MEHEPVLSPGETRRGHGLTPAQIRTRFAAAPVPGQRGDETLWPTEKPRRPAAVLVPLLMRAEGLHVLLTQRTPHLSSHAGQVAFPGGRTEEHDFDAVATALRETEEEVGLPRSHIEVVGRLDLFLTGTGFSITPVVGLVAVPYPLHPDPSEVADAFEVPLDFILDENNRERRSAERNGRLRHFFVYPYAGREIWGATAAMLVNLAEVLTG